MDKKLIKKNRMMRYFIDAAKTIIDEEGIKNLTIRKVGDKAGYSYATIYNYFKDIRELLAYCAFDFMEECYEFMKSVTKKDLNTKEQIIAYSEAYLAYFSLRPQWFYLVFIKDLGEITKPMTLSANSLLLELLNQLVHEGILREENIQIIFGLIKSSLQGKLLLLLHNRNKISLDDLTKVIRNEINLILSK